MDGQHTAGLDILAKLREAKELADTAFWQLLDLRILLAGIETEQITGNRRSGDAPPSGLFGTDEHYTDAEDYVPQGDAPRGSDPRW